VKRIDVFQTECVLVSDAGSVDVECTVNLLVNNSILVPYLCAGVGCDDLLSQVHGYQ
jgi:hypothetical protein